MKVFAQAEHGVISAPTAVEDEICYQYGSVWVVRLTVPRLSSMVKWCELDWQFVNGAR